MMISARDARSQRRSARQAVETSEYMYMDKQSDLDAYMRTILIDWLTEINVQFGGTDLTVFITVHILDKFLSKTTLDRTKLQLFGTVAYWVASKLDRVSHPTVYELFLICDRMYAVKQFSCAERFLLKVLDFNILFKTALHHICDLRPLSDDLDIMLRYILMRVLYVYEMLHFKPFQVATCARALVSGTSESSACTIAIRLMLQTPMGKYDYVHKHFRQKLGHCKFDTYVEKMMAC
jgi:hypothetical protein